MTFCNSKTHFQWCDTGLKAQRRPARLNTSLCVCFVRPQPINSEVLSLRLDKPIKFMSFGFFKQRKEMDVVCSLLRNGDYAITWCFFPISKLSRVPPKPYDSHHPALLFPALITHYWDLTKSSISNVLCHILSARLSRCCDCTIQL